PLRNFLGDNENAIKVQIWCALIADLLLKVIQMRTQKPWSFANLASMVGLHLMTYINLLSFLNKPEQTLLRTIPKFDKRMSPQLFPT
ncbi:MAG TPA: transposase, partial [Chryseosolibacter sp.]|nr:transposase [Chryseosolibacter sp.]